MRSAVTRVLLEVRLPPALFDELRALHASDPARYRHAVSTAAVTVGMLLAAVGDAPALPDLAAAGLLHDLGMRHVPPALARGAAARSTRRAPVSWLHIRCSARCTWRCCSAPTPRWRPRSRITGGQVAATRS